MTQPSTSDNDFRLAERCLAGEHDAIGELREFYRAWLLSFLARRGAIGDESEQIAETLLTDCVVSTNGRRPVLAAYLGQCPLRAWLSRVALNRLISLKRTQQREQQRFGSHPGDEALTDVAGAPSELSEEPVLRLLHEAIVHAFEQCEPESLVMLQLLHADELHPDEIAPMFDCVGTTVTRTAERARAFIRAAIVAHIRARDPWLEITYDDLIAICRTVLPESLGLG